MELALDNKKIELYHGFVKNYPEIPRWIVFRTLELASTPGKAFDALCDLKMTDLPVSWDFQTETWQKESRLS